MGRHYVDVETPQGDFRWYLPTTELSYVTFPSKINKPNYTEFCEAVLSDWNIDITVGELIPAYSPLNEITEPLAAYFNTIPYNLVPANGDIWKIGNLTGTWTVTTITNGTKYMCQFRFSDNNPVFQIIYAYYDSEHPSNDQRFQFPLVYSTSEEKLIVQTGGVNQIAVYNATPYYRGFKNSTVWSVTDTVSQKVNDDVTVEEESDLPPDPYDPGGSGSGYSGTGGGPAPTGGTGTTGNGGLHDDTSDVIPTPSTPSDVVISSGIFTAYNPSASQLASFASALWNMQVSDINDVLRFLFGGDAFNAIIGLHLLPVAPSTGSSSSIKLGNWDTGVSAPKITSQYAQVSFGSVLLPEYWGNCIDYAPYTRVQLALPYIGMVDVDTDDVLGSTNTLTYNIDVLSGALCAMLHCVKGNLTSVIYQWSGSCAVDLPITGANKNAIIGAIGASGVVTSMAFSAAGGGLLGGLAASAALAGSAASAYGTAKGKVQKNGNFGSHAGALGIMTPYFIVSRPVQSVPTTWQADKGYPANISAQLGTVTGYTEVSEINLECSGTEAEKKEIIDLLKKGVIF